MLMRSALPCDSSQPPFTRLQSALFASPPTSPPPMAQSFCNIFTTSRALQSIQSIQSMLSTTPATNSANASSNALPNQLPTPPLTHAILPPLKLRLRSRKNDTNGDVTQRKKIVKRSAAPPRGLNKRRRVVDDDMGRDDDIDSDLEIDNIEDGEEDTEAHRPCTPKRARIAPEQIPLGLGRSDFHNLHKRTDGEGKAEGSEPDVEADDTTWSEEDDRMLVELILDKLKLTKSDWQDCARSLGKDRSSISRRWQSLMVSGDVGLKRSRRNKIHQTWR